MPRNSGDVPLRRLHGVFHRADNSSNRRRSARRWAFEPERSLPCVPLAGCGDLRCRRRNQRAGRGRRPHQGLFGGRNQLAEKREVLILDDQVFESLDGRFQLLHAPAVFFDFQLPPPRSALPCCCRRSARSIPRCSPEPLPSRRPRRGAASLGRQAAGSGGTSPSRLFVDGETGGLCGGGQRGQRRDAVRCGWRERPLRGLPVRLPAMAAGADKRGGCSIALFAAAGLATGLAAATSLGGFCGPSRRTIRPAASVPLATAGGACPAGRTRGGSTGSGPIFPASCCGLPRPARRSADPAGRWDCPPPATAPIRDATPLFAR